MSQSVTPIYSLFTSADVATLRTDRLLAVANRLFPEAYAGLADDFLLSKIVAEESRLSHDLRTRFVPTEFVPSSLIASVTQAIVPTDPIIEEPGYDYTPDMFLGDAFGLIELRQRFVLAVYLIQFDYPAPADNFYQIPPAWIRLDKKYGKIQLVPIQASVELPLNSFLLSALGGGQSIPYMLQVRYRAGLANARLDYPELVDLILKRAVLSIIEDQFLPQSASISADGLSQNFSIQVDKLGETLEKREKALRQLLNGIPMMVL